tara:strand:+ start:2007 stop:2216 length:210 start_codon:yes stop_codon:yes gene_type:complete
MEIVMTAGVILGVVAFLFICFIVGAIIYISQLMPDYCEKHQRYLEEHGFDGARDCPDCRVEMIRKSVKG